MRSRSAFATAEEDDVRIEVAAEDAERFAIGRPREAAATLFGRLPNRCSLCDIFSQGVRMRRGGMTSL
jgi:hypothetical protein